MPTVSEREKALQAVQDLPRNATIEDAMDRLYLLLKIERGLAQADAGQGISHQDAKQRMARWLE